MCGQIAYEEAINSGRSAQVVKAYKYKGGVSTLRSDVKGGSVVKK